MKILPSSAVDLLSSDIPFTGQASEECYKLAPHVQPHKMCSGLNPVYLAIRSFLPQAQDNGLMGNCNGTPGTSSVISNGPFQDHPSAYRQARWRRSDLE
jgi:hypothetical protein